MLPYAAGPRPGRAPPPCLIAPCAHNVFVVRPAASSDASPPAPRPTGGARTGPSMFQLLRAQRQRRAALRMLSSHHYSALPQSEPAAAGASEKDTDESMA